jgi:O-antigen/teichoic acid export membrane protein
MGIDLLMVSTLLSVRDSGIYAACFRLTPALILARVAMDYAFGPKVGALLGKADYDSIGALYKASSVGSLAWTLPFAIVMMLFGQELMGLIFGSPYAEGGVALSLLAMGFVFDGATGCNSTLLSMAGKPWLSLLNGLTGGTLTLGSGLLLIPHFGIAGAALSVAIARIGLNALATFEVWHFDGIHPFSAGLQKVVVPAAAAALLGYVCKRMLAASASNAWVPLATSIAVVFLAYLAGLGLFHFKFEGPNLVAG